MTVGRGLETELRSRLRGISVRSVSLRDYGIVFSVVLLCVILSLASPVFLTPTNILNILDQNTPVAIIAIAGTFVIIGGSFDLSVGAIFALSGAIAAIVANSYGTVPGLAAGMVTGCLIGIVNGLLVTVGRIHSFIATIATQTVVYGLAQVITGGYLITVSDPSFAVLGNASLAGIHDTVWVFLAVAVAGWFLLVRTSYGRYVFAIGGNQEAARFSGIRVNLLRATTFAMSGLASGLAGVLVASRISQGEPGSGTDLTLTAIASIVIGGTSIMGGEGAVWRTLLGVLLLALIGNGFNLLNFSTTYQQMAQGLIIIGAVSVDAWSGRSRR